MKKLRVGILGATGTVGQKFIAMLAEHPWFQVNAVAASDRSAGKCYGEVTKWGLGTAIPSDIASMPVQSCQEELSCDILFSGLDSSVAYEIEATYAKQGYVVVSNASPHRMDLDVPLLIPEVNANHLALLSKQQFGRGALVTNPNCSVIGIAMALKPLVDLFHVERVHIVTMQAISGAGYPGVPSLDILDNVIPFIQGEEHKVEQEPLKILGSLQDACIIPHPMKISAQCMRVPVTDGHMACLSVKFATKTALDEIIHAWDSYEGINLPTAPKHPLLYSHDERHPQPKLHRLLNRGMSISLGRLRPCPLFDWKFVILSHNTVRGAAGCAILNAELMVHMGYFPTFTQQQSTELLETLR